MSLLVATTRPTRGQIMHEPQEGKQKCTRCGETKDSTEFYIDSRKVSGVSSWCKKCSLKVARAAVETRKKAKEDKITQMRKV